MAARAAAALVAGLDRLNVAFARWLALVLAALVEVSAARALASKVLTGPIFLDTSRAVFPSCE